MDELVKALGTLFGLKHLGPAARDHADNLVAYYAAADAIERAAKSLKPNIAVIEGLLEKRPLTKFEIQQQAEKIRTDVGDMITALSALSSSLRNDSQRYPMTAAAALAHALT